MADAAVIALIGLLLLLPLEVMFLIVLALLVRKRREFPEPVLKVSAPLPRQGRYGWEDYLKLPEEKKKPSANTRQIAAVSILVFLALLLIGPAYLFFPSLTLNLTAEEAVNAANATIKATVGDAAEAVQNATYPGPSNFTLFSNFTLSHSFNVTLPFNVSALSEGVSSFAPYLTAVAVAAVVLVAALGFFIFAVRQKRLAILKKAKLTAEKLIRQADASARMKKGRAEKIRSSSYYQYIAPATVLFLLLVIAFLVYLLRGRIRTEFADFVLASAVSVKEFALLYRSYIAFGVVLLVVIIVALRYLAARRSKKSK